MADTFGDLSKKEAQNTIRDAFIEALKDKDVKKVFGGSGGGSTPTKEPDSSSDDSYAKTL